MSTIFAPRSVRMSRWHTAKPALDSNMNQVKALEYLLEVMDRVVLTEKYLVPNMLVLDVKRKADKAKLKLALEAIAPDNKLVKITTLNIKPTRRMFRGIKGTTSGHKRVYARFENLINIGKLLGGNQ